MPISGIKQPNIISIEDNIRLRKYDGIYDFAISWYQDEETVKLVDGVTAEIYNEDRLNAMYTYLDETGELYLIDVKIDGKFIPIGDVTLCKDDMPIVIGNAQYRGMRIGEKVIRTLVNRAIELGFTSVHVHEIYYYNQASIALFSKLGFKKTKDTGKGFSFELDLHLN